MVAVSMNMSMSRSDFMISDAAIPMRMEELALEQQEQSAAFADILGGIGLQLEAESEPTDEEMQLIMAIANGEITADELPEGALTDKLFAQLEELMRNNKGLDTEDMQNAAAELAAMLMAQPEKMTDDKSAELSELTGAMGNEAVKEISAVSPAEPVQPVQTVQTVQPEQPEQNEEQNQLGNSAILTQSAEQNTVEQLAMTAPSAEQNQVEQPVIPMQNAEQNQPAVTTQYAEQNQPAMNARNAGQNQAEQPAVTEQNAQQNQIEQPVANLAEQEIVAEQNVPTAEVQAEAAEVVPNEAPQKRNSVEAAKPFADVNEVEAAEQTVIPVQTAQQPSGEMQQGMQDKQYTNDTHGDTASVYEARQSEAAGQERLFENAELTVTERQAHQVSQEQPEAQKTEQAAIIRTASVQERVVKKSDELEMLKNAVKRNQPEQTAVHIPTDAPVNIPMAELPEVKPAALLEQVEVKLTELAEQTKEGVTEYTLTLNPEDLGKITVKMTKASDGAVSVSIAAENARTQRILEESGAMLQSSLRQHGIELESWQTVNESQQDMHAEDYRGSGRNQYHGEENRQEQEPEDGESFSDIIANM